MQGLIFFVYVCVLVFHFALKDKQINRIVQREREIEKERNRDTYENNKFDENINHLISSADCDRVF